MVGAGAARIAANVVGTAPVYNKLGVFLLRIYAPLILLLVTLGNGERWDCEVFAQLTQAVFLVNRRN